jgi:hypothetical protein
VHIDEREGDLGKDDLLAKLYVPQSSLCHVGFENFEGGVKKVE